jgi:DNA-binding beta-propeller fold protein YncE
MIERKPSRRWVRDDPYATFNFVTLDEERGEVFFSNDGGTGASIEAYRAEFPEEWSDRIIEPLRKISGPKADLGGICSLAVSPEHGEIFKVNDDGNSELAVFPLQGNGDIEPLRWIPTSHGAAGVFLDRRNDELFVSIEHVNRVAVYKRTVGLQDAISSDPVLRFIQGPNTALADPHGIYVNSERNEIFVGNHGSWHLVEPGTTFLQEGSVPPELLGKMKSYTDLVRPLGASTGKFFPPSINVYSRTANGDVAPLRMIQGPKTLLNVPLGITFDSASNQLVVINAGDDSILFFDITASGNVAPVRVLKGGKTGLGGPTSVAIDGKRNELWVSNWLNHTATVYPRNASGDVAPLRIIRSAPKGTPALGFAGEGLAYNAKRKEILSPN